MGEIGFIKVIEKETDFNNMHVWIDGEMKILGNYIPVDPLGA